jgi:hypothetical protein
VDRSYPPPHLPPLSRKRSSHYFCRQLSSRVDSELLLFWKKSDAGITSALQVSKNRRILGRRTCSRAVGAWCGLGGNRRKSFVENLIDSRDDEGSGGSWYPEIAATLLKLVQWSARIASVEELLLITVFFIGKKTFQTTNSIKPE